eukprot:TRINITY_DN11907_c0_g1_i1.p1 TRINITY_DN11907_c0_g1~~TRINITY_DN11907_c0_g1_i1.p1  ORF type:complete len:529 (-),score=35.54 TRINITY_DN11907_c0_g1_i1:8-1471(-)
MSQGTFESIFQIVETIQPHVFLVEHRNSRLKFIAKKMKNDDQTKQEVDIMKLLSKLPHVVKYYGSVVEGKDLYVIMEYCPGGDIVKLCASLTEEELAKYTLQILQGLEAVHKTGLVHKDIKPQNIFLDANRQVKIGDFGSAVKANQPNTNSFTFCYGAPELFTTASYDKSVDIWSVGLTVAVLRDGGLPLSSDFSYEASKTRAIEYLNDRSWGRPQWSENFCNFVLECVNCRTFRPTASKLLQHPFLAGASKDAKTPDVHDEVDDEIIRRIFSEIGCKTNEMGCEQIDKIAVGLDNLAVSSDEESDEPENSLSFLECVGAIRQMPESSRTLEEIAKQFCIGPKPARQMASFYTRIEHSKEFWKLMESLKGIPLDRFLLNYSKLDRSVTAEHLVFIIHHCFLTKKVPAAHIPKATEYIRLVNDRMEDLKLRRNPATEFEAFKSLFLGLRFSKFAVGPRTAKAKKYHDDFVEEAITEIRKEAIAEIGSA